MIKKDSMITKEQLKAFLDQQIAEKGKMPLMIEAMRWALDNKFVSLSRIKSIPLEMQQKEFARLMLIYVRTLM